MTATLTFTQLLNSVPVLGSVLSDNVTFSCTLSGLLAYYISSNRFNQRPILVVLHVSITLVVGSPYRCVLVSPICQYQKDF